MVYITLVTVSEIRGEAVVVAVPFPAVAVAFPVCVEECPGYVEPGVKLLLA